MTEPLRRVKRFVAREDELAALASHRRSAARSLGSVVVISGEAGIGKTSLLQRFLDSIPAGRTPRIVRTECLAYAPRALGPWRAIVAALATPARQSAFDEVAAQAVAYLAPSRTTAARDESIGKAGLFAAVAQFLREGTANRATIVAVEDIHWADTATLQLLAYVAARIGTMRLCIVATLREGEPLAESATTALGALQRETAATFLTLGALDDAEIRALLLADDSPARLSERDVDLLVRRAEGNPLFAEELLRAERSRREHAARHVPGSIRALVDQARQRLPETAQRIVQHAAVLGERVDPALLARVIEEPRASVLEALREARDAGLLVETGDRRAPLRFRHALTRDAVLTGMLDAQSALTHERAAIVLESVPDEDRDVEALAHHWWEAGNSGKVGEYSERAGDAARQVYAHNDAIAFYERALEPKVIDSQKRGSILEKIANLRLVLSMAEEGEAAYDAAAEAYRAGGAVDREAICRVRAAMTGYTIRLSDTSESLEQMLARSDVAEYLVRARLHLGIAWIAVALRFPTRARAHLAAVDARARDETDVGVRYHNVAACVAAAFGDAAAFRREHAAWLEAARAHGAGAVAGAHYNGAKLFASFGLHEEARENIRRALVVARETRSRHAEECAHATAALCYILSGDLEAARDAVEAVGTMTDNRVNLIFATAAGTALGTYLGDERLIERWFDGFEATVLTAPEIESGHSFAEVLVRRGRRPDAQALLHRVLPECELVRGEVLTLLAVGRYGTSEDRARAREHLARGSETGDSLERPALMLFDAICEDERPESRKRLAREAAEGFARFRVPLLEAEAHELAGDAERALSLYRRCGASYHVCRLEGRANHHAASSRPLLSPRERVVAELIAQGTSNVGIARSCGISRSTVEKHVASIFTKLGVGSRAQIAAFIATMRDRLAEPS